MSSTSAVFYCENYFDIDDILSQSNRVAVCFNKTIPKLGFLDPGAEDDTMVKGTKLGNCFVLICCVNFTNARNFFFTELPLWIVKELSADQVVSVTIPKGFNHTYREILEADANCVNLNKLGPNFYRFGQHLATMNLPESEDVAKSLIDTYTQRFHRLINFALSGSNVGGPHDLTSSSSLKTSKSAASNTKKATSAGDDINTLPEMLSYTNSLDNWEKDLLKVGQSTASQLKRWQNRDLARVKANEMVTNLHKRKRLVDQHLQMSGQNVNGHSSSNPSGSAHFSGPQSAFK